MKKSTLTFAEGFTKGASISADAREKGNKFMSFDWDKAALIIKERSKEHSDLVAEAGLQDDWSCTGGVIFEDGKPTNTDYTYLKSNWATPTLILEWDGEEQKEIECFTTEDSRFDSDSKWDDDSIKLLGITL